MSRILRSALPYNPPARENLIQFIHDGLQKNRNETIIIDSATGTSWTGQELESTISKIAKFLVEDCNLKKGDVCSLYADENDQVAILILAIACAGGVSNYLTSKSSGREIHDTATVMKSKFLFSTNSLLSKIQNDLVDLEENICIISLDEPCATFKNGSKTLEPLYSKDSGHEGIPLEKLIETILINPENDYAVIQFSSGTTGKPKPIPRTHKNLCHLVASVNHKELMNLNPGIVLTGSLPITHRPGLWALLASVNCGSTFVIWSNLSDVEDALATIAKYKVTIFSSSLPFLSMLGNTGIKLKDKFDLCSWQHIITSGAKIVNPKLPEMLVEKFELKSLRQCFGMTESGWVFLIEQTLAKNRYLTVGHPVPGIEAKVIDRETLEPVEEYARGEIALRGPQIFPGYLTAEPGVLNRSDFTKDGWFRIGDQAYYDEEGLVHIEGRYKEVMMFENNCLYFPTEIEAIIAEHPAIEGVCVVKTAEVRKDYPYDIARACVTLKHGYNIEEKEILEFVKERMPQVILGGGVKILSRFPRLQNGKVDKQTLSLGDQ